MDDLIFLSARHTVSITVENRSFGTSNGDVSLSAIVVATNEGRKLTAHAHAFGPAGEMLALREEALRGALGRLRRQVEVLEALG